MKKYFILLFIFISFSCKKANIFDEATKNIAINIVADPVFSLAGGTYPTQQTLTLTTDTDGAAIRYTIDGTNPSTTNGTLYSGSFFVTATSTVKAIAYKDGAKNSNIISRSYVISNGSIPSPDPLFTGAITYFAIHNSKLYCGTKNTTNGAEVYLITDESTYTKVLDPAALGWSGAHQYIDSMVSFGGRLYVGVYNATGGQVWRTTNTSVTPYTWEKVHQEAGTYYSIGAMIEYGGNIVIGVSSFDVNGAQSVKVYYSADGSSFTNQLTGGDSWGLHNNECANFIVYGGNLLIATLKDKTNFGDGCELFSWNGSAWTALVDQTFGVRGGGFAASGGSYSTNMGLPSFTPYGSHFYMGVKNVAANGTGITPNEGCKIWRANNLNVSGNYQEVVNNGFGNINNISVDSLIEFGGNLYALTRNNSTGTEMWGTSDGGSGTWTKRNSNGFGNASNVSGRAAIVYNGKLYIGLETSGSGATVLYFSTAP